MRVNIFKQKQIFLNKNILDKLKVLIEKGNKANYISSIPKHYNKINSNKIVDVNVE